MEVALASAALALAAVTTVFAALLRRRTDDLYADLQDAIASLASAEAAFADQVRTLKEHTIRTAAETRAHSESCLARVTADAANSVGELSAQIATVQDETRRALDALGSRQEAGDAAVIAEVAALIDRQREFLRNDLEARIAQRDG